MPSRPLRSGRGTRATCPWTFAACSPSSCRWWDMRRPRRSGPAGRPGTVGGLHVSPGHLIHADQHGVLLIPREVAAELPAAADRVISAEQTLLKWVRSSDFDADELIERRRVRH